MIEFLIFGPLLGSLIAGLLHRSIGENVATIIATSIVVIAGLISWFVFLDILPVENDSEVIFEWITSGALNSQWAIKIDSLVKVMLVVVLSISSLVHIYSLGYMRDDHNWSLEESIDKIFLLFVFFTFAMLVLVSADNLLQLFFGWEGVGVASTYLLIGFILKNPAQTMLQ